MWCCPAATAPLSWAKQYGGANAATRPAARQLTVDQAKRHYRKKCPNFFLVIGIIVIGLRRALRHTSGVPRRVLDKDKRAGVFRHPLQ